MSYSRFIIGDAHLTRFWPECQLSRPQLVGVPFKSASCFDTLVSALSDVTDGYDYVLISVLSSMIIDEASPSDVTASSFAILRDAVKSIGSAAKKSSKVEVRYFFFCSC